MKKKRVAVRLKRSRMPPEMRAMLREYNRKARAAKMKAAATKKIGRPGRVMPPRTDYTAEEAAQAFLALPPDAKFEPTAQDVYHCVACEKVVEWPEVLHSDGVCGKCRRASKR